jgi:hypothetical protein
MTSYLEPRCFVVSSAILRITAASSHFAGSQLQSYALTSSQKHLAVHNPTVHNLKDLGHNRLNGEDEHIKAALFMHRLNNELHMVLESNINTTIS